MLPVSGELRFFTVNRLEHVLEIPQHENATDDSADQINDNLTDHRTFCRLPNKLMINDRMKYPINSPTSTQICDLVYFHEVLNTSEIINFGSI